MNAHHVTIGIAGERDETRKLRSLFKRAGFLLATDNIPEYPVTAIDFVRDDKSYRFVCGKHEYARDNLRATQLAITGLYRIYEDYGVSEGSVDGFDKLFGGHLLGTGEADWWTVLNVARAATRWEVDQAFKKLARIAHPDKGGSHGEFVRVERAYREAIAEIEGEARR